VKNIGDLHVIFLGDGILLDECKKLCETLQLQNNVIFCGHISEPSVYYKLADCVISASRFEGLPFNVIEALYFNKPVIASNVKGHKDLIKHDFNGYLFEYGNLEQLAESIEKIVIDENYNRLKNNAVLDAKYLYENVKNEILKEYINC
jgi:glycosyltransferase EpsD